MSRKIKTSPQTASLSRTVAEQAATIQALRSRTEEMSRENRKLTDELLGLRRKHTAMQDMLYEACRAHNERTWEESGYAVLQ